MTEWNENLTPWKEMQPSNKGGKGNIETYGQLTNIVWQSRSAPPTDYENSLGDALEDVMADGTHDLPGIIKGLTERGVKARDGKAFDENSFKAELKRLAD
jgi:Recombinase-like helix-turn-helix domain